MGAVRAGELKLAGEAAVLEDRRLKTTLDDLFWQMIEWRPAPDSHYFELRMRRAAFVTYDGDGQAAIRWQQGGEETRTYRPGI